MRNAWGCLSKAEPGNGGTHPVVQQASLARTAAPMRHAWGCLSKAEPCNGGAQLPVQQQQPSLQAASPNAKSSSAPSMPLKQGRACQGFASPASTECPPRRAWGCTSGRQSGSACAEKTRQRQSQGIVEQPATQLAGEPAGPSVGGTSGKAAQLKRAWGCRSSAAPTRSSRHPGQSGGHSASDTWAARAASPRSEQDAGCTQAVAADAAGPTPKKKAKRKKASVSQPSNHLQEELRAMDEEFHPKPAEQGRGAVLKPAARQGSLAVLELFGGTCRLSRCMARLGTDLQVEVFEIQHDKCEDLMNKDRFAKVLGHTGKLACCLCLTPSTPAARRLSTRF